VIKNLFSKNKRIPQTYEPVMEAQEVLEMFSRLTLHQQAVLMRLMSRNLIIDLPDDAVMGYELDWGVEKAMVVATMAEGFDATPTLQSPADA